jgi:hypothetical protein
MKGSGRERVRCSSLVDWSLSALEAHYAGVVALSKFGWVRGGIIRRNWRSERPADRRAAAMVRGIFVSLMPGGGSLTLSDVGSRRSRLTT